MTESQPTIATNRDDEQVARALKGGDLLDSLGSVLGQLNSSKDLEGSKSRTEILDGGATRLKVLTGLQGC